MKKLFIALAVSFAVAITACNKKASLDEVSTEELVEEVEEVDFVEEVEAEEVEAEEVEAEVEL